MVPDYRYPADLRRSVRLEAERPVLDTGRKIADFNLPHSHLAPPVERYRSICFGITIPESLKLTLDIRRVALFM